MSIETFPDLIARVRAGDAAAADALYRLYQPQLRLEVGLRLRDPRLRRLIDPRARRPARRRTSTRWERRSTNA
jgi:hypothetical protein